MATEIILPRLDEAMVSGRILVWKRKEGDYVEKGDVIFVLETEKIAFEVEAPESGILGGIIIHSINIAFGMIIFTKNILS